MPPCLEKQMSRVHRSHRVQVNKWLRAWWELVGAYLNLWCAVDAVFPVWQRETASDLQTPSPRVYQRGSTRSYTAAGLGLMAASLQQRQARSKHTAWVWIIQITVKPWHELVQHSIEWIPQQSSRIQSSWTRVLPWPILHPSTKFRGSPCCGFCSILLTIKTKN